jgi:hypothetical protein
MKKSIFVLFLLVLTYNSCKTEGGPVKTSVPEPVEIVLSGDGIPDLPELTQELPEQELPEEEVFDAGTITQEVYDTTKKEVQQFISELNGIIRARNYNDWVSYLGSAYFEEINSPDFLRRISESSFLKSNHTVLSDARDYFIRVVVPSRMNSRVDDIEFVSQKRVKAFTVTASGQRLRLYDLEDFGDGWKIIN